MDRLEPLPEPPPTSVPKWPTYGVLLFFLVMLGMALVAGLALASRRPAGLSGPSDLDETTYWNRIYPGCGRRLSADVDGVAFVYDTYPGALAPPGNLMVAWPPKKGEAYRLVANPFPPKGPFGDVIFLNAIYSTFKLIDTFNDDAGFPGINICQFSDRGWMYDNPFMPAGPDAGADVLWGPLSTATTARASNYAPYQWTEVAHACYALPGIGYPACDDGAGAFWLYGFRGTGVWWNCGKACIGLNKIERGLHLTALVILWNCWAAARLAGLAVTLDDFFARPPDLTWSWKLPDDSPTLWQANRLLARTLWQFSFGSDQDIPTCPAFDAWVAASRRGPGGAATPSKVTWKDVWDVAVDTVCGLMYAKRGQSGAFSTILSLVNREVRGQAVSPDAVVVFRRMEATGESKKAYLALVLGLCGCIAAAALGALTLSLLPFGVVSAWLPAGLLVLAAGLGAWVWFSGIESMISGVGWRTLQGQLAGMLRELNLPGDDATARDALRVVLERVCSPYQSASGEAVKGASSKGASPAASSAVDAAMEPGGTWARQWSGLSNTWVFDNALGLFGCFLQYDSIVLSTQPNKSGVFATEIVDVTRVRLATSDACAPGKGSMTCMYRGGLCGCATCVASAADCSKGGPIADFFSCESTIHGWTALQVADATLPPDAPVRGGLCRGFRTTAFGVDPRDVYASRDPLDRSTLVVPCACPEAATSKCLSCLGHISGDLCAPLAKGDKGVTVCLPPSRPVRNPTG
jgi:hypothetical protein